MFDHMREASVVMSSIVIGGSEMLEMRQVEVFFLETVSTDLRRLVRSTGPTVAKRMSHRWHRAHAESRTTKYRWHRVLRWNVLVTLKLNAVEASSQ